jgi:hypothetical protein
MCLFGFIAMCLFGFIAMCLFGFIAMCFGYPVLRFWVYVIKIIHKRPVRTTLDIYFLLFSYHEVQIV